MSNIWKWVDEGRVAVKQLADGAAKSCQLDDPELAAYIAGGGAVDPSSTVADLAYAVAQNVVDPNTDDILAYGFEFNGIRFPMDLVHEEDYYKTIQLLQQEIVPYPFTIKGAGAGFMDLTAANIGDFFTTGFVFKRTVLPDGWAIKYGGTMSNGMTRLSLDAMAYADLQNFVDPRGSVTRAASSTGLERRQKFEPSPAYIANVYDRVRKNSTLKKFDCVFKR